MYTKRRFPLALILILTSAVYQERKVIMMERHKFVRNENVVSGLNPVSAQVKVTSVAVWKLEHLLVKDLLDVPIAHLDSNSRIHHRP